MSKTKWYAKPIVIARSASDVAILIKRRAK